MNMTRIIRNTVYQVKVYNDRQDDISMEDALIRLIVNSPAPFPGGLPTSAATAPAKQAIV